MSPLFPHVDTISLMFSGISLLAGAGLLGSSLLLLKTGLLASVRCSDYKLIKTNNEIENNTNKTIKDKTTPTKQKNRQYLIRRRSEIFHV